MVIAFRTLYLRFCRIMFANMISDLFYKPHISKVIKIFIYSRRGVALNFHLKQNLLFYKKNCIFKWAGVLKYFTRKTKFIHWLINQ